MLPGTGTTPGHSFIDVHLNRVIKKMTWISLMSRAPAGGPASVQDLPGREYSENSSRHKPG